MRIFSILGSIPRSGKATTAAAAITATLLSVAATTALTASAVQAETFSLTYSGAAFGNTAQGVGTIELDLSKINNPGATSQNLSSFVTNFSLTITGASAGNGTFSFADFNGSGAVVGGFVLETNGATLDFTRELVGQPTDDLPFGSPSDFGAGGDFNIFFNETNLAAPTGSNYFQITTNSGLGLGDNLYLTSFRPTDAATAIPEPGTLALLSAGLLPIGTVATARRKRKA